jgi:hypothetical protein
MDPRLPLSITRRTGLVAHIRRPHGRPCPPGRATLRMGPRIPVRRHLTERQYLRPNPFGKRDLPASAHFSRLDALDYISAFLGSPGSPSCTAVPLFTIEKTESGTTPLGRDCPHSGAEAKHANRENLLGRRFPAGQGACQRVAPRKLFTNLRRPPGPPKAEQSRRPQGTGLGPDKG